MKILLTGVAGFIGSHLGRRLLDRGDAVVGVDNFDPFYPREIKEGNLADLRGRDGFDFHEADIRDAGAMQALFEGGGGDVDTIVHLAAKAGVRPSIEDPIGYVQTNIIGTTNLLECAAAMVNKPKFIFASSSSVYGNNAKVPFHEADRVDEPISPYAATKKACELLCHTYHHLHGLDVMALRFFTVYGPSQRPDLAIHKFIDLVERGEAVEMYGDGTTSRDYTYIDDIVDGCTAAIDRCAGFGIVNLGSREPIALGDMIDTIARVTGRDVQIIRKPMQPGDVQRTFADVTRAEEILGYAPSMPFEEGIRRFVDWYRSRGV